MVTLEKIVKAFEEEEILKADGFDDAVIGIDYDKMRLIYSVAKVIEILKKDMNAEDAWEHFAFNIAGSYVGEKTPIWCYDLFE
jgi:hypothetical protein